jgi:photosystem II stability/assembly factor-like uncharacterized protein
MVPRRILVLAGAVTAALAMIVTAATLRAQATDTVARAAAWEAHNTLASSSPFRGMQWRADGPTRIGARVEAIAVPPGNNGTIYVGVGTGNVWKTVNNGLTWRPIFDHESAFAIGDIAVSGSNANVVWVGTGEAQPRYTGYGYPGTGVFKSTDAGATWTHMGLSDSHHIAKVIIHPDNPDIVYVASIGHEWSSNAQRGVFTTTDGGAHWTRVLFINDSTGVVDMAMDPANPKIIYAWAWHIESGTDGGLYRTADGGDHWSHITNGLPSGALGRAGIDVAPGDPNVVYIFLDNRAKSPVHGRAFVGGEVYRSSDRGESWRKANAEDLYDVFGEYGWKFADVRVSPANPNDLFILGNHGFHSTDGGRTWRRIGDRILRLHDTQGRALHLDQHEIWIDPLNPDRVLLGNDGGLFESYDEGESWLHLNDIPVVQMYFVATDSHTPYNIFAGTQDDAAIYGPSNASVDDATPDAWRSVYLDPWTGGDSFVTLPDPTNDRLVYYEHQNGSMRRMNLDGLSVNSFGPSSTDIHPHLTPRDTSLRFSWYTPFLISRYDPHTLYAAGTRVLRSADRGATWKAISSNIGDPAGGDRAVVPSGAATMLTESPIARGTLIVGTEGGSLWRTIDDGAHWKRIGKGLPHKWVSRITISAQRKGTVYVSFTGFREDDTRPYLFVSDDLGDTWRSISSNLPMEAVNVIKEDPANSDILFAGTDMGAYVSMNRGARWESLSATLPTTPIQDLTVQARDHQLVLGSYGRGAWILDVAPIEWLASSQLPHSARPSLHVFAPRTVKLDYFPWETVPGDARRGRPSARIYFIAPDSGLATISVRDSSGKIVRRLQSAVVSGINSVTWDLRADVNPRAGSPRDVRAGRYEIDVRLNGEDGTVPLVLLPAVQ